MKSFREEVEDLVNRYSMENGSNTPDFILATYLSSCLKAFDTATRRRDKWYAVDLYPGCTDVVQKRKSKAAMNPVQEFEGKWYNETWTDRSEPFDTEEEATEALKEYGKENLGP